MKKVLHKAGEVSWLIVETPEGACQKLGNAYQFYWHKMSKEEMNQIMSLMKQPYDIIGLADSIGEEVWKEIVERDHWQDDTEYWYLYEKDGKASEDVFYVSATESGHSLLGSYGMQPSNCVILKQVKL